MFELSGPFLIGLICGGIIIVAAIIILITVLIVKKGKKGQKRVKIDDNFINGLLDLLGGKDNISKIDVDNGRLKFTVKNLEIVNLEGVKNIATSGVFVTGNVIKTLFKLDSFDICKAIEKRL